jgi:hypothetical protein
MEYSLQLRDKNNNLNIMQDLIIKTNTPSGPIFSRAKATSKEDFVEEFFNTVGFLAEDDSPMPTSVTIGGCKIRLDCKVEVFTIGEFLRFADGKDDPSTKLN